MTDVPRAYRGARQWPAAVAHGLYRCLILVELTGAVPLAAAAVAFFGIARTRSWSARLSAPHLVRMLAALGEYAMAAVWTAVAVSLLFAVAGRPLCESARCAWRWNGLRLEARYQQIPQVTQMATGFWWSGHEYHRTEAEARRRARQGVRSKDPQVRRDAQWLLVAAVTVLPAAAAPWAALVAGVVLAATGLIVPGLALVPVAVAAAPFAWRLLGPVAAGLLGADPQAALGERAQHLETVRADLTRTQAAELVRIERDLHDGTQARLVALDGTMHVASPPAGPTRVTVVMPCALS